MPVVRVAFGESGAIIVPLYDFRPVDAEEIAVVLAPRPQHPPPMKQFVHYAKRIAQVFCQNRRDAVDEAPLEPAVVHLGSEGVNRGLDVRMRKAQKTHLQLNDRPRGVHSGQQDPS